MMTRLTEDILNKIYHHWQKHHKQESIKSIMLLSLTRL